MSEQTTLNTKSARTLLRLNESRGRVERQHLKKCLCAPFDADIRKQFLDRFGDVIDDFIDSFGGALEESYPIQMTRSPDTRESIIIGYVVYALNSLATSFVLLISGYLNPSCHEMRQFLESAAMALLVSDPQTVQDPTKVWAFPIDEAISRVGRKKVQVRLGIDPEGWTQIKKVADRYSTLSHANLGSLLASTICFESEEVAVVGIMYDPSKEDDYLVELTYRTQAAKWLKSVIRGLGRRCFGNKTGLIQQSE